MAYSAGVDGRVTELCKVSQRKYNLAIAVLMGKTIDSIVVDSERTAKDCIQYLKDQGVPPMTFIPIQTVKVSGCAALQRSLCVVEDPA
jgi:structural maintenance of chromosome 1